MVQFRSVVVVTFVIICGFALLFDFGKPQGPSRDEGPITSRLKRNHHQQQQHNDGSATSVNAASKQAKGQGQGGDGSNQNSGQRSIHPYTIENLKVTISQLCVQPGVILIYDPHTDSFLSYYVAAAKDGTTKQLPLPVGSNRLGTIHTVLVQSLRRLRPRRFQPDQATFQLFLSEADFTFVICGKGGDQQPACPPDMAPWIHFGSYFRNSSILTCVHEKPHYEYMRCLRQFVSNTNLTEEGCTTWKLPFVAAQSQMTAVQQEQQQQPSQEELIPKVIWRGSNLPFLESLTDHDFYQGNMSVPTLPFWPRRLAVNQSLSNNESWLDATFPPRTQQMSLKDLSLYRYHLDLGGAGGTTWPGTLEKLAMPGLLLHHETPSQDWFYSKIKAWQHYVPVRTDLSDLQARYHWAESHPEQAFHISQQGIDFVRKLFSRNGLRHEYEKYFGPSSLMGPVIDAYQPSSSNDTLQSVLADYTQSGITYKQCSHCTLEYCDIQESKLRKRYYLERDECIVVADSKKRRTRFLGGPCP